MNHDCKCVLVVEDDAAVRQSIQDVLEIYGYKVFTASNGSEAIESLLSMPSLPCVILLDLMMPGMNGWGFLDFQKANPHYAGVPVVICSAYEGSAKSINSQQVLIKPVQLDSLVGAVKAFCK